MPPLKGIDRGLNGEALKALEESGHGRRLAIVDASYNIPRWAQVVDYQGEASDDALSGILDLVPTEQSEPIVVMDFDEEDTNPEKYNALAGFTGLLNGRAEWTSLPRLDQPIADSEDKEIAPGFYSIANNEEEDTLFVRTRDRLPYACVTFVIGHSQVSE